MPEHRLGQTGDWHSGPSNSAVQTQVKLTHVPPLRQAGQLSWSVTVSQHTGANPRDMQVSRSLSHGGSHTGTLQASPVKDALQVHSGTSLGSSKSYVQVPEDGPPHTRPLASLGQTGVVQSAPEKPGLQRHTLVVVQTPRLEQVHGTGTSQPGPVKPLGQHFASREIRIEPEGTQESASDCAICEADSLATSDISGDKSVEDADRSAKCWMLCNILLAARGAR